MCPTDVDIMYVTVVNGIAFAPILLNGSNQRASSVISTYVRRVNVVFPLKKVFRTRCSVGWPRRPVALDQFTMRNMHGQTPSLSLFVPLLGSCREHIRYYCCASVRGSLFLDYR